MKPGMARARVATRRGKAGKEGEGGGGNVAWVEYASSRLPILGQKQNLKHFKNIFDLLTSFTLSTSLTSPTMLARWKQ